MSAPQPDPDRRWPHSVYGLGSEPDPRFSFANERTFLAWIRTGLGFLVSGIGIATLADLNPQLGVEAHLAAVLLIACGVVSGVGAMSRWMRNERAMRLNQPLSASPILALIAGGLVLIALLGLVLVGVG